MSLLLFSPKVRTPAQFQNAVKEALRPLTAPARAQRVCCWLARWSSISETQADVLFSELHVATMTKQQRVHCASMIMKQGGGGLTNAHVVNRITPWLSEPNSPAAQVDNGLTGVENLDPAPQGGLGASLLSGASYRKLEYDVLQDLVHPERNKCGNNLRLYFNQHVANADKLWDRLDDSGASSEESIYDIALWTILTDMSATNATYWTHISKLDERHPANLVLGVVPEWRDFLLAFHQKSESLEWIIQQMGLLRQALEVDWYLHSCAAKIYSCIEAAEIRRVTCQYKCIEEIDLGPSFSLLCPDYGSRASQLQAPLCQEPQSLLCRLESLEESIDNMILLAQAKRQIIDMWKTAKCNGLFCDVYL